MTDTKFSLASLSPTEELVVAKVLKAYFPQLGTEEEMSGADVVDELSNLYSALPQIERNDDDEGGPLTYRGLSAVWNDLCTAEETISLSELVESGELPEEEYQRAYNEVIDACLDLMSRFPESKTS